MTETIDPRKNEVKISVAEIFEKNIERQPGKNFSEKLDSRLDELIIQSGKNPDEVKIQAENKAKAQAEKNLALEEKAIQDDYINKTKRKGIIMDLLDQALASGSFENAYEVLMIGLLLYPLTFTLNGIEYYQNYAKDHQEYMEKLLKKTQSEDNTALKLTENQAKSAQYGILTDAVREANLISENPERFEAFKKENPDLAKGLDFTSSEAKQKASRSKLTKRLFDQKFIEKYPDKKVRFKTAIRMETNENFYALYRRRPTPTEQEWLLNGALDMINNPETYMSMAQTNTNVESIAQTNKDVAARVEKLSLDEAFRKDLHANHSVKKAISIAGGLIKGGAMIMDPTGQVIGKTRQKVDAVKDWVNKYRQTYGKVEAPTRLDKKEQQPQQTGLNKNNERAA